MLTCLSVCLWRLYRSQFWTDFAQIWFLVWYYALVVHLPFWLLRMPWFLSNGRKTSFFGYLPTLKGHCVGQKGQIEAYYHNFFAQLPTLSMCKSANRLLKNWRRSTFLSKVVNFRLKIPKSERANRLAWNLARLHLTPISIDSRSPFIEFWYITPFSGWRSQGVVMGRCFFRYIWIHTIRPIIAMDR